jgi:hypothetical protein
MLTHHLLYNFPSFLPHSFGILSFVGSPLWYSGQSSWLQIQRFGFDSQRYQIFWEIVSLERDPLSLVSTTEEPLGRKSSSSSLEIWAYGRRDQSRCPRGTLYPQKVALTSTSDGCSVGTVRSRTQATELSFIEWYKNKTLTRTHAHAWVHKHTRATTLSLSPPPILLLLEAPEGIFRSSALMPSMVVKWVPLRPTIKVGKSQKSLRVESREYNGWVIIGMFF